MEKKMEKINEKLVPVLANRNGTPGVAMKDTETGQVTKWSSAEDIKKDPKLKSEIDPYFSDKGKQGYRIDPRQFKIDLQRQKGKLADIRGSETPGSDKPAVKQPEVKQPEVKQSEVKQPPKPVAKTYDVDGEKLTKAQINTRYNELRKQAGGLQPGSSAEKFGMSANQAIFGKNFAKPKTPNHMMAKYKHPSVEEAYDVVLDYLLSEGHADTVEEAHYVMMQLDSEYVQSIVEAGLPIPPGGIKPDRLNPIDPATGKSMYKVVPGASGKPKEIRNPSFGKLPPA